MQQLIESSAYTGHGLAAEILGYRTIITHLQPIYSVRQRTLVGVEALSRGIDARSGALILPHRLFSDAQAAGISHETHNCCRDTALRTFAEWNPAGVLLFLNFDVAELES